MQTYYREERNEKKQHSKQDRPHLPKNIIMEKRVPHEHFNLYSNFIAVLIQQDKMSEMKGIPGNAGEKGRY